jgi:hypothetical protein
MAEVVLKDEVDEPAEQMLAFVRRRPSLEANLALDEPKIGLGWDAYGTQ